MHSGYLQLIATKTHSTYEDGDILGACNHLMIRRVASHRICFARKGNRQFIGLNGSGFLPYSHILKDWHDICCEFRFERLTQNTCKKIRLSDMAEVEITTGIDHTDFDGRPKRMDVELYFRRQLKTFNEKNVRGKPIFSDDGNPTKVVIYGGDTNMSSVVQDIVWTAITSKTGKLEADETTYAKEPPFGSYKRNRLIVKVNDFTYSEGNILTESLLDKNDPKNPITIKKRKSWVDWENDLGLSGQNIVDVKDDKKNPDLRGDEKARSTIVKVKTL